MSPESIRIADEPWAADIGSSVSALRPDSPHVREHAGGLLGYPGIFILVVDAAPVISVPPAVLTTLRELAGELDADVPCRRLQRGGLRAQALCARSRRPLRILRCDRAAPGAGGARNLGRRYRAAVCRDPPAARGRGHTTRVTLAAGAHARRAGLLPQYRVLKDNLPSLRVASKLGFERYGWTLAVRLEAA